MNRLLKWIGAAVVTPIAVAAVAAVALYLPPVQDFAVKHLARYASEQTGMDISIGRLRLSPWADLRLDDFTAVDADGDTVVAAREATVDLRLKDVFKKKIGIEGVTLDGARVNTKDMVAEADIRGSLDHFELHDDVDLGRKHVDLKKIAGRGLELDISLRDTTVEDTTKSEPLTWTAAVKRAQIEDSHLRFATAGDSLVADADIEHLSIDEAEVDLGRQLYKAKKAQLKGTLKELKGAGVLENVNGNGSSQQNNASNLKNDNGNHYGEKGLPLELKLEDVAYDGERQHVSLPSIDLKTPTSQFKGGTELDLKAFGPDGDGAMDLNFETDLSKADIRRIAGKNLPKGFDQSYPEQLLHVKGTGRGNLQRMTLNHFEATLPGAFTMDGRGELAGLNDSTGLKADIDYNLETKDVNWLRGMADGTLDDIRLPQMSLAGNVKADGTHYSTLSTLREGGGMAVVKADIDTRDNLIFDADVRAKALRLKDFMPSLPVSPLTGTLALKGTGTDINSRATHINAKAKIATLRYDKINLDGTTLDAELRNGRARARVTADNPLLTMQADLDGILNVRGNDNVNGRSAHSDASTSERSTSGRLDAPKNGKGSLNGKRPSAPLSDLSFSVDLSRADLQGLGLVDDPLKVAACMHLEGTTDLKSRHRVSGTITDIILQPGDTLFRPEDVTLEALLRPDTTYAHVSSGDLVMTARGRTSYDRLLKQLQQLADEATTQMKEHRLVPGELKRRLPQMDVHLTAGQHNPAYDILKSMGYDYEAADLDLSMSPSTGINGGGHIHQLNAGTILLDTINFHAVQDSTGIALDARVHNGRRNPQISFDSRLAAHLGDDGRANANLLFYDDRGQKGIDLGLQTAVRNDSLVIHLDPLNPVIAYRRFHLNEDNTIRLGKKNRVTANVDLLADDGTGLKIYSADNDDALQDLTVSVNHLNLGELMTVLPYAPRITGYLHGDAHLIQTAEHLSVSTDMTVDDLTYEGAALGQVGLEGVYLPNTDGSHYVDGSLLHTGMPVATFNGTYTPRGEQGLLDINASLDRLPFALANGFFPDGVATLSGVAIGDVHVGGTTARPRVDGSIVTSDLLVRSAPYSLSLRVADDTLRFDNSHLKLDNVRIYSTGRNPLTANADVDFTTTDKIRVNATLAATNYELINAKKTSQAVAYGKVYVDLNTMVRGTLDDLRMYGRLKVLGSTDLTYVLTDSPLTVEDQLADLVEFVDFTDTVTVVEQKHERPQNLNITMSVSIDDAAQVHCLLSADGSSYVDLEGGGDLTLTYSPEKDLQMNGRYTVNSGTLKYTMMVIPLKEFTIKSGSYAEFRGPLMNPTLNISATERLRTTITENQQPRSVNFDVGMNITQTLEDLGLEFTLDAPEDLSIRNELAAMSAEQRGRVAVTMLATGMYITDANSASSGGFSTQNALNAFLQSQISNITSKALKSVDLSLGMEQGTSATGSTTTDYSFRFAKRFWGNRISVIVGGKVSTGANAQNTGQSLIDNVSIEYRLDQSASRYVKVYYDKNYESLLESEVTEMGAGLVLRRKTTRLGDLFLFKKKKEE
ncbi:MAG: translocation/assembly module TamB domain-containing protein [Bacteroidaceae bacterium]|nr:translocation/assembly module TamB domain-containing protein [Bacteroidaceae bacterium]